MIAAFFIGTTSAAWNGKVLDIAARNGEFISRVNVSGIEVATVLAASRIESGCNPPQVATGDANTPAIGALPANTLRVGEALDLNLVLDPANGGEEINFKSGFDAGLADCTLVTSVSGNKVDIQIKGESCDWVIHKILVKGGSTGVASYTFTGFCTSVSGMTTSGANNPDVSNYAIVFKEIDSGGVGDPIITTFDGVQYRVDVRGTFLNTHWHNGQHKITSCFYSPKTPAIFTRAISYRCGTTNMVAHLAKSSLENWQTDMTSPVKYNVYYFDDQAGTLLNNTGDFGKFSVPPGEYSTATESQCPLDSGKVSLTVTASRNKWQHEAGMVLLNSKIRLIQDEQGRVADVNGGLSQSITGFLTDAAQVETKYGWSTDETARFISGPNTNGETCAQEGLKFTMDHNEFLRSNCGAASWAVKDQENVFNSLARLPGNDVYVQSCELQEYIPVY
eukprot:CAMPEP_0184485344 /NCGR_PEP_ID=MMETSP0113_2-20130426/6948_1 /TAXON_ID=91329 /ORGANISM="Norrisiella sphaerica, Strain BC52" /LENGTH=448 /DNA_ID=CAMNT_0026866749 /DNA_START=117 /DNA_END=1463 /DNA_ORIENTATION=+